MSTIKPFDAGGWFPIHNAVFDVIMPRLSPNGWKILCVAIRQTWGWVADSDGDPRNRREWDRVSYSQFNAKSGIKSRSTVARALKECLESGYLLRHQVGMERGMPAYAYALNRDFEVEWPAGSRSQRVREDDAPPAAETPSTPDNGAKASDKQARPDVIVTSPKPGPVQKSNQSKDRTETGTKSEPVQKSDQSKDRTVTSTKNGLVTGSKTGLTKQRKINKKQKYDDDLSVDKSDVLKQLTRFGVDDAIAYRIVSNSAPADVRQWLVYTQRTSGLKNPVAFLVRRLLDGEPPPEEAPAPPDPHVLKTAMCPVCYLVRPVQYICSECELCFDCCTCVTEAVE